MGHPYRPGGNPPHSPAWLVHKQSGGLVQDAVLKPEVLETDDSFVANFGLDPNDPQARGVVLGDQVGIPMMPRPVVWGTLGQLKEEVKKTMIEEMRSGSGAGTISVIGTA